MSKFKSMAMVALLVLGLAGPATADFCVQVSGGPFSGDLGLFRFKGGLPKGKGSIKKLNGRVAGLSPVFGTATVYPDGSGTELGFTFFADATQGQVNVSIFGPTFTDGFGYGDYGAYGTGESVTATIIDCTCTPPATCP